MTIGPAPICISCKHCHSLDFGNFSCKAFPNGIPRKIKYGEITHDHPIKGDKGIMFEPKDEHNQPEHP